MYVAIITGLQMIMDVPHGTGSGGLGEGEGLPGLICVMASITTYINLS